MQFGELHLNFPLSLPRTAPTICLIHSLIGGPFSIDSSIKSRGEHFLENVSHIHQCCVRNSSQRPYKSISVHGSDLVKYYVS